MTLLVVAVVVVVAAPVARASHTLSPRIDDASIGECVIRSGEVENIMRSSSDSRSTLSPIDPIDVGVEVGTAALFAAVERAAIFIAVVVAKWRVILGS
jgi:hypothetical protein